MPNSLFHIAEYKGMQLAAIIVTAPERHQKSAQTEQSLPSVNGAVIVSVDHGTLSRDHRQDLNVVFEAAQLDVSLSVSAVKLATLVESIPARNALLHDLATLLSVLF